MKTSLFDFQGHTVRVVLLKGQPWFVAADVATAIGLKPDRGVNKLLSRITRTERRVEPLRIATAIPGGKARRGNPTPPTTLVSESGLYKLIMRSSKPEARKFQDWVTQVVLPRIRQDGGYILGEEKVATGEMSEDALILLAFELLKKKAERAGIESPESAKAKGLITVNDYALAKWSKQERNWFGRRASKMAQERKLPVYDQTIRYPQAAHRCIVRAYPRAFLDEVRQTFAGLL